MEFTTYSVIELQTTDGTTSVLSNVYTDRGQAEQKYHQVLSYAAVSNVDIHSVVILSPEGFVMKNDVYFHNQETQE